MQDAKKVKKNNNKTKKVYTVHNWTRNIIDNLETFPERRLLVSLLAWYELGQIT